MKTLDIHTSHSLASIVRDLQSKAVLLVEGDIPLAVLLPLENADLETVALSLNPQFLDIIERSKKRILKEGAISSDEMRRRLGIEPADESGPGNGRQRKAN